MRRPTRSETLVVGIDVGTGGSKVSIVDATGRVVGQSRVAYESAFPHPGWVEQSPDTWLEAVCAAMDSATADLSPSARRQITAVGFSAPTHVAVLIGSDAEVLRPAIMWNDQRSGDQARAVRERDGRSVRSIVGNTPSPTWTLPQLIWLREHEPEMIMNTTRVVFMKDWVREQLSDDGPHVTDRIDAEGACLLEVGSGAWSDDLVGLTGLRPDSLPSIVEPTFAASRLRSRLVERWGLADDVVMVVGASDTAAELLSAGAVRVGDGVVKIATAGNVALVSADRPHDQRLLRYSHLTKGLVYLNSATSAAAESLRWVVENFVPRGLRGVDYRAVDEAVTRIDPGSGGVLYAPFLHGERAPRFDEKLRAGFVGFTAGHSWPHAVRAVMEGVAFSLRDAALLHGPLPSYVTLVGGGGRSQVWPQIVADVLNVPVVVAEDADSSVGAALIAGVGTGLFPSYESASDLVSGRGPRLSPDPTRARFYDRRFADYLEFATAIGDISHRLTDDP